MKYLSFLILTLHILVSTTYSQWISNTGQTVMGAYSSTFMIDSVTGWLAGHDIVLKTTDGGDTWSQNPFIDSLGSVWKIKFLNDTTGFAIGSLLNENFMTVFKTYDGGTTWSVDNSLHSFATLTPGVTLYDISFAQDKKSGIMFVHGIAYTGAPPLITFIFQSTDFGKTWNEFTKKPDSTITPSKIFFIDSAKGFFSTSAILYKTTTGGNTWDEYSLINGAGYFLDFQFFNADTGIFFGHGNAISSPLYIGKTFNGGETWSVDSNSTGFFSFSGTPQFCFTDINHGFVVNWSSNAVLRTTNTGSTWIEFKSESPAPLMSVHSTDGKNVVAGGNAGKILVSHDSGITYTDLTPPEVINFSYVKYLSKNLVVAFGNGNNLFLSVDSGKSWTKNLLPTGLYIWAITFLDSLQGWVADDSSRIFHTTNTGKTWVVQKEFNPSDPTSTYDPIPFSIHFVNGNIGCVVGESGYITATTNGGEKWTTKVSPTSNFLWGVFLASPSKAWAVGEQGTIIVSTDSCNTWSLQTSPVNTTLRSVTFTDTLHGYILGDDGTVLKTTNGGNLWVKVESPNATLNAIKFINQDKGWLIGSNGKIFRTSNGGMQWEAQASGVDADLNGIDFVNASEGIIVGSNGVVLTTRNAGGPTSVENKIPYIPFSFNLEQNYPNPFNPNTTIRYDIPNQANVSLKIYNVLGQEVITLVNETKQPGRYNVQWNATGMASGMYFYHFTAGDFVATKKLLLLK